MTASTTPWPVCIEASLENIGFIMTEIKTDVRCVIGSKFVTPTGAGRRCEIIDIIREKAQGV
jgi:hypothetical protein